MLFFIAFVFPASGQPVDTLKARTIAKNFLSNRISGSIYPKARGMDARNVVLKLASADETYRTKRGSTTAIPYYVYNVRDKINPGKKNGFVIVAADMRITPVLGYSFSGEFTGQNLPPAFKAWMDNYQDQINEIIRNDIQPGAEVSELWKDLSVTAQVKSTKSITEVLPMVNTKWSQGCDYNIYCPADTVGDCDRAIAGCVAVAMAQIMKYWNYPASNNPIPAYQSNQYGVISGVAETMYRWSRMSSSLRSTSLTEEKDAVSELIYHCGVSVKMDYGPRSSSASTPEKPWTDYFRYSRDMEEVYRSDYTDSEWASVLKKELQNRRPVFYVGYSDEGGHAFVCDGYQGNNCFHFNWGWGGYMDGYFYADNLTVPKMLFGTSQRAMIGIEPGFALEAGVATSIEAEENTGGIKIYPVPASDHITLDFGAAEAEESVIEIVGLGGTSFYKETFMAGPDSRKIINVSDMKAGYYILRIKNEKRTFVRKVMIR